NGLRRSSSAAADEAAGGCACATSRRGTDADARGWSRSEAPGIRNTHRKNGPELTTSAARLSHMACVISETSRKSGMRSRRLPIETFESALNEYQVRTPRDRSAAYMTKPAARPKNQVKRDRRTKDVRSRNG